MKTKTLFTTVHPDAVSWGVERALGELVANALDASPRRGRDRLVIEFEVEDCLGPGTLTLRNPGQRLPRAAVLVGWRGPAHRRHATIGRAGDGLPMALVTLAERGFEVEVRTGTERWRPRIAAHPELGEDVLALDVEPHEADGVEVVVRGVSAEDWTVARESFLELDHVFDPKEAVGAHRGRRPRVLLQPALKGRIYNRGRLEFEDETLGFGYDLDEDGGRDRSLARLNGELDDRLAEVLRRAIRADPERMIPQVARMLLDESDPSEGHWRPSRLTQDPLVRQGLTKAFHDRFGEEAGAVLDLNGATQLDYLGRRGVIVSPLVHELLGEDADEAREAQMQVTRVWNLWELPSARVETLSAAQQMVADAVRHTPRVIVVDFRGREVQGTFDSKTGEIRLAAHVLKDPVRTLETLVHEVAHVMAGDGERAHMDVQVGLLSQIAWSLADKARARAPEPPLEET